MAKISKGIVITTSYKTIDYLKDLLLSIVTNYPILIHINTKQNNGWELAGIQKGKDHFDEFVHLMDSTLIKDNTLFENLFNIEGNVFITTGCYHYMGKFVSDTLPELPKINTKEEAIEWELKWLKAKSLDLPVHTDIFEDKFGEKRMKLENNFIIKWKGTFHI